MSKYYPRIRIQGEFDHLMAREGLSFTFYMRRAHMKVAPAVLQSLETYLRAIGPEALGWYTDDAGEYWELDAAAWERTRRKVREARSPLIFLYDSTLPERRYRFEYHGKDLNDFSRLDTQDATCAVSFWLPTEFLEDQGPGRVRELALELAAPLPFCSGYGGLSFNGELDVLGVDEEVTPYCLRYPGIDVDDVHHYSWKLGTRLRAPHWLTFLGQPVLGELGGAAALRSRLHSPDTTVLDLEGDRALVTLGKWPEAGDLESGDNLPAYRELARVLEPWLFDEPRSCLLTCTPEETRRWVRRFLD
ncbi:DUF3396 domain-containing protein [Hyalangium rubrum]|uniref:DUF3396 domain-containing protein n=1 Tax=Hyalangium rubrum TaxID=3103134 RepID=A0ABU5H1Z3_9BACT|nr:DUF3396 domain-containing protein [Hyalangium sp. s54d21]MDY7227477.1 DUF3396 domain-containing protein [Hyalangium sp. s54d21]